MLTDPSRKSNIFSKENFPLPKKQEKLEYQLKKNCINFFSAFISFWLIGSISSSFFYFYLFRWDNNYQATGSKINKF